MRIDDQSYMSPIPLDPTMLSCFRWRLRSEVNEQLDYTQNKDAAFTMESSKLRKSQRNDTTYWFLSGYGDAYRIGLSQPVAQPWM